MRALAAPLALAAVLSFCPQARAATPPDEPARAAAASPSVLEPAPPEGRRVRIILMRDGVAVGGSAEQPAAAPQATPQEAQIEAAPLEPLAPPAPLQAPRPDASAATPTVPSTGLWTEDQLRIPQAPGDGWKIQVGAFRDAARAEARIAELETTAAGPGADPIRLVVSVQEPDGAIYRAQMSGFTDRASADGACARLTATGAACFVIAP